MRSSLVLFVTFSLCAGCEQQALRSGRDTDSHAAPSIAPLSDLNGHRYFPEGREGAGERFPRILNRMKEPSILRLSGAKGTEEFRFLYAPSFYRPLAVRVFHDDSGDWFVRTVRLSNPPSQRENSTIDLEGVSSLKDEEVDRLRKLVRMEGVLVRTNSLHDEAFSGFDGSSWILEALIDGEYWLVAIREPHSMIDLTKDDVGIELPFFEGFIAVCEYLLELAEVSLPKRFPPHNGS